MLRNTLLLMLPLAAWVPNGWAQIDDVTAVEKAAFRVVADPKAFHTTGKVVVVCLSIGVERPPQKGMQVPMGAYSDPPAILLKALGSVPLPVVKGSGCWANPAKLGAIYDTSTKVQRPAVAIIMSRPEKVKDGLYKFLLERAFDVRTARGFRCTASKKDGVWTMAKCADGWIVD